jgi:hypothetical protein
VLEGEPMALPRSLRELNDRTTKAGEDLKEFYSQLRRGGAPRTERDQGGEPSDDGIPNMFENPRFVPTEPFRKTPEVIEVTPIEALAEVVNNPEILVDTRLMNLINSPTVGMNPGTGEIGPIESGFGDMRNRASIESRQLSRQFERQNVLPRKKRKVSKYQKEFGRQLKKLKAKHPRTKIQNLMKRAHAATRKALK